MKRDASDRVLRLFGKLSRRRGASTWFHGVWTCSEKSFSILNDFSLKIKLNHKLKISEELECAFGVVGKILMSRI